MSLFDYGALLVDQLGGPEGQGLFLPADEYRRLQGPGCDSAMAHGWGIGEDGTVRHAGWYVEAVLWSQEGAAMAIISNDGRVEYQREARLQLMEEVRTAHLPSEGGSGI